MLFDLDFSDPPLLPLSLSYLPRRHIVSLCTCSVWCVLLQSFFVFFLGECMRSAQGKSVLSRQRSG
ncbi:unnamed protein product, partial [Staurois parvus]